MSPLSVTFWSPHIIFRNGPIRDTTVIDILFQVAQALYDNVDFSNMRKDDYQHPGRAITHFVLMVNLFLLVLLSLTLKVGGTAEKLAI